MKIEELKQGQAVWIKGYADGLGNIDFLSRKRIGMVRFLTENEILKMSDSEFKLDEPLEQKLEVPKCIYELIEYHKKHESSLFEAMLDVDNKEVNEWFEVNEKERQDVFAKAWLDYPNITVKKEKLYTVKIPNPNEGQLSFVLMRQPDGNVRIKVMHSSNLGLLKTDNDLQLTEKEIKKDFDWAFRWAEEVTE